MGYAPPNTAYEVTVNFGITGLVGDIGVSVNDNLGAVVVPRTTAGIIEYPPGSGLYATTIITPVNEGQYSVVWDDSDGNVAEDDLTITSSAVFAEVGSPGTDLGPCTAWVSGQDVATCCNVDYGTDPSVFDDVALEAAGILFELSGRRFPGICYQSVRPCRTTCGCPWQILSRGHIVWNPLVLDPWYGWWSCDGDQCGCFPLSRVLLSGYVQEVIEVLIDGVTVDPATYRVDQHRWLVRTRETADDEPNVWPGCQNLDLPPDQEGTWEVTYTFGHNPPLAGQSAAKELACQIWKACNGSGDCELPSQVTRVSRQGVVLERQPFVQWGFQNQQRAGIPRGWNTGMKAVDYFLNAYNPAGIKRQPVFWSPATSGRYAQAVG